MVLMRVCCSYDTKKEDADGVEVIRNKTNKNTRHYDGFYGTTNCKSLRSNSTWIMVLVVVVALCLLFTSTFEVSSVKVTAFSSSDITTTTTTTTTATTTTLLPSTKRYTFCDSRRRNTSLLFNSDNKYNQNDDLTPDPSGGDDNNNNNNKNEGTNVGNSNNNNNSPFNDFFNNVGKFFGNPQTLQKLEHDKGKETLIRRSATKDFAMEGGTLLLSLEATQIKVGALRLLLTLWLFGQQNYPHDKTWKCNQSLDGDLDMYYIPEPTNGAITIELTEEYGLRIYSLGNNKTQSNSFIIQQNVLLNNLLNELEHTVLNPQSENQTIKSCDKLLILKNPNAIQEARETIIGFS